MRKLVLFLLFLCTSEIFSYNAVMYIGSSAQPWEKLIAKTLAGIVNRDSSRLYLMNVYETWNYSGTDEKWADIYRTRGKATFDTIRSVSSLIERFRTFIKGGICYDANQYYSNFAYQNIMWQGEYAALIGGLTDRLPVTFNQAAAFGLSLSDSVLVSDSFDGDPAIYITGRLESPANPWNTVSLTDEQKYLTILSWGIRNLLPRCNPGKLYIRELTDFTVQKKMFQINLAGNDPYSSKFESLPVQRADLLEQVLQYLHSKNPDRIFHIYGWMTPEPVIQWFAFFGASFHETLLSNISWHSSFPVSGEKKVRASIVNPDTVSLDNKYYLVFLGTEGDAGNWNFGFQSGAWLSPDRGKIPVGWGWNLQLMHECPFVREYYQETATVNDGFISVASPLGYAYPDLWPESVWQNGVSESRKLMAESGVNDIYAYKHYANGAYTYTYRGKLLDNSFDFFRLGKFSREAGTGVTMLFDPKLATQTAYQSYGGTLFNHSTDGTFYGDVSNLTAAANRILLALKGKLRPAFMLAGYQRFRQDDFLTRPDPENTDITLSRLASLINIIKADQETGRYTEVVTPELFSVLLKKKLTGISSGADTDIPEKFSLLQNYPNPFNPVTTLKFEISRRAFVDLRIYNTAGEQVSLLLKEVKPAGKYTIRYDAGSLASGIYFCRLLSEGTVKSIKMVLIK